MLKGNGPRCMSPTSDPRDLPEGALLRTVRWLLLAILAIGLVGTATDLVLIEHYEDAWQLPPLVLIAAALLIVLLVAARGGPFAVGALRVTMVLFLVAGAAGVLLHYNGNTEFQKEMDPSISGWPLFVKAMTAKAPPALAPGSMVQLGLIGLLYTYRHPSLTHATRQVAGSPSRGAQAL
jgi:hypothetical protein